MQLLSHISKRYLQQSVLDDISLAITPQTITCLLGPSGCGKSTLLRLVAGLIKPDAGSVKIRPQQCAMVFQEPRLLPWLTVAENLALALPYWPTGKIKKASIAKGLAMVQLSQVDSYYPHELSGGMAQRVGIARALLQSPTLFLMDEPFAALDAITRSELQQMLSQLIATQAMSCLFITHDINEALILGDTIMVMRQGKIVTLPTIDKSLSKSHRKAHIIALLDPSLSL